MLKTSCMFVLVALLCVSFSTESIPSIETVVPENEFETMLQENIDELTTPDPVKTTLLSVPMKETKDRAGPSNHNSLKGKYTIKNGQEFRVDKKWHNLYDFTRDDIADQCVPLCVEGCDNYQHVEEKKECKACGECVLRDIFRQSIPEDCRDSYDHERYTGEPKTRCDLPFEMPNEQCSGFFSCYFSETSKDEIPWFVKDRIGHALTQGDPTTGLPHANDKIAPEEKEKDDTGRGETDWETRKQDWQEPGGPYDFKYDENPFKYEKLPEHFAKTLKKAQAKANLKKATGSDTIDFAKTLRDTAANLEGANPEQVLGYHANDGDLHQLLRQKAGKVLPHEFSKLFMDKDLPLSVLLSQPVGTAKCNDVATAFKHDSSDVPLDVIDFSGKGRAPGNTLLQAKEISGTILKKAGSPKDPNAKWMVLIRDFRKGHGKPDPITLPDDDKITDYLRGVTVDPHRDVVFEMTPSFQKSGKKECLQWVVRHMREGVGTLAKAFEAEGRKHLEPILGKVTDKIIETFDAELKKKVFSDTQTKKYEKQSKLFKNPREHLKRLLEQLGEKLRVTEGKTEEEKTANLKTANFHKAMQSGRKLLGGGSSNSGDPYLNRRRRNQAKTYAFADKNARTRSGITRAAADNAYYGAQIDLLDRSDVCTKTWPTAETVLVDKNAPTLHGSEPHKNPVEKVDPSIASLQQDGIQDEIIPESLLSKPNTRSGSRRLLGGSPPPPDDRRRRRADCRDPGNPSKNENSANGGNTLVSNGKPARQSSEGFGGAPARAVDGNTNNNYGHNSCTHTHLDQRPWWQVNLQKVQVVKKITVWNRGDCCGDRLSSWTAHVSNSESDWMNSQTTWRYSSTCNQGWSCWINPGHAVGQYVTIEGKSYTHLTLCEVQILADDPMKSLSAEGQEAKDTCCGCIATATGRMLKDASNAQLTDRSFSEVYSQLAKTNPKPDSDPDWSGCVRTWTQGRYSSSKNRRRRQRYVVYREDRDGTWKYMSSSGHNIPSIVARANGGTTGCHDDDGGRPGQTNNWCNQDRGCAVAILDQECVRCECVSSCSTLAGEVWGNDPATNNRLQDLEMKCDGEDVQDMTCVRDAVYTTFCFDIPGVPASPDGVGNSCRQGSGVGQIVLSIVFWVIDFLLGCALGFIAQPSFWSNMVGPNSSQRSSEVYGAKELGVAVSDVKNEPKPTQAEFNDAYAKGQTHSQTKLQQSGKTAGPRSTLPRNSASTATSSSAASSGWSAGQAGRLAKTKVTSMRNAMKMSKLKAIVPCAISVMIGLVPIPGVGIAAAMGVFASCMLGCIMTGLGLTLATFVFEICSTCIFDILGKVLQHVCFPAHMTVQTADNNMVRMDKLQIGDHVHTADTNSEVYLFSHRDHATLSPFIELKMRSNHSVMASPRHFFPVSAKCDGKMQDMYAIAIQPGMCLLTQGTRPQGLVLTKVVKTSMVWSQGLFNPFTMTGQLMVNGVLASSHSDWFLDSAAEALGITHFLPSIYQTILAPARWMYNVAGTETARKHLDEMQENLNKETSVNGVFGPFMDAAGRLAAVMMDRASA